ncbi:MAG: hypothetical protein KHX20_04650 [Megasphaera sp.]|jgi:hypothetical protein|nr:hypothetical protein [Megasphaera sp.]
MGKKWGKASDIAQMYSLGRTHVYDLIGRMRKTRRFKTSVVQYHNVLRVNLKDNGFSSQWTHQISLDIPRQWGIGYGDI